MTSAIFNRFAVQDFDRAISQAHWRDWLSLLIRKDNNLISLDEIRRTLPIKAEHYLGLQSVPLDKIVGSEGRYQEFDRAFFPRHKYSKSRWISIDKAHYKAISLPPVELFKVDEVYFVRDGNHRISVARTWGWQFIDAYVTEIDVPVSLKMSDLKK